jgi:hypothetical protein
MRCIAAHHNEKNTRTTLALSVSPDSIMHGSQI